MRTEPNLTQVVKLLADKSVELEKMLAKIAALRDADKLKEARKLMKDAEVLRERREKLIAHYRRP